MANIKISGFYDEVSSNLDEQIKLIKEYGESYLCPRVVDGKNIANYTEQEFRSTIKPRLDNAGIKFSSIGSPIGKIGLYDDEAYESQLTKLKELVKICKDMDCKYIRIFSFRVKASGNYDEYFPEVVKKLRGFLKVVEGTDVILLHENEKRIYGDTPERCLQLYKEINHPQFKLAFDASNFIQCDVNVPKAYEMLKDYVVYYHIKDCSPEKVEVPVGLGLGNYKEMIKDLIVNRNYEGFMTLEPHTGKYADHKKLFYIFGWFTWMLPYVGNWNKVFKRINAAKGISPMQSVTRKDIFTWQYQGLKEIIDEVEKENK